MGVVLDLVSPVTHYANGGDDQSRLGDARSERLGVSQDQGDNLDRLSQAHVIGQNTATRKWRSDGCGEVRCDVGKPRAIPLPELHNVRRSR